MAAKASINNKTEASSSVTVNAGAGAVKVPRHRSPQHPTLTLERALEKVTVLREKFRTHGVPLSAALEALGYKADSSSAMQVAASITYYGLAEISGAGDKRSIAVTSVAAKIIDNHSDRPKLIQEAALRPAMHDELWKQFYKGKEDGLSPDPTIRQYLQWDRVGGTFNPDAIDPFIQQFKDTIRFAKLLETDAVLVEPEEPEESSQPDPNNEPAAAQPPHRERIAAQTGSKQDVFTLEEGQAVLQWPAGLSESSFEDLKDWIELALRKIKRSVKLSEQRKE